MGVFTWNDNYRIGNEAVDSQHQRLFELANQLVEVKSDDEIKRLLMLFYQHVREHFEAEEALMKQAQYPGYQEHQREHNQMLDRLVEISEADQLKQWDSTDLKEFVNSWVLVHILGKDMSFGKYLKT